MPLSRLIPVPENIPRTRSPFGRRLGLSVLALLGWRVEGEIPNLKKMVMIAAPHTSNWDFIIAMSVKLALGLYANWMMKKEAFLWPLGSLWKNMGGIPIDRRSPKGISEQIVEWFQTHDQVIVGITPEGTRKKVEKWKTGFLRIANAAQVPILIVAWDYPNKTVVFDSVFETTGDTESDLAEIQSRLSRYTGRNPENQ